jgi:NADH dehydrogenase FAD-containing subunit
VPRADCLDGSGGAMAGSGLAAPAPILAAMFALSDGLRATPFPIGITVAVIRGQRAAGPARSDQTLPGHPEVFVVGDLMSLDGLPGVAQVAIQSGRHAAATIRRRLAGDAGSRPFRYRDRGSLNTISRFRAVGSIGFGRQALAASVKGTRGR